jgi:hypothetical protein
VFSYTTWDFSHIYELQGTSLSFILTYTEPSRRQGVLWTLMVQRTHDFQGNMHFSFMYVGGGCLQCSFYLEETLSFFVVNA